MISLAQNINAPLQPTKQIKRNKSQQGSNNKRRAKRACVHCKKAKTSCSNSRPCERCIRLGLGDTCMDPPHSDITNEDRQLWETTLKVLTENKHSNHHSQEQKKLMEMLQNYAQRVSQPVSVQDSAASRLLGAQPHPSEGKLDFLLKQNDFLSRQVEFLTRQMELNKAHTKQLVKGETFYQFSLLSTMGSLAYSRWTFPDYILLDYNHGFLELSGHRNPEIGRFNCANLFMEKHLFACGFLVMLLRDGIVKSVEVNQLWSARGQEIPVKAIMVLNFDQAGNPIETVMYCKRSQFPFPAETLFKPLEFEMSKQSKAKGFTADMLRRLFNRSCTKPPVDTYHEQFAAPGSITVQALLQLNENPHAFGNITNPMSSKSRCPLKPPLSAEESSSPLSSVDSNSNSSQKWNNPASTSPLFDSSNASAGSSSPLDMFGLMSDDHSPSTSNSPPIHSMGGNVSGGQLSPNHNLFMNSEMQIPLWPSDPSAGSFDPSGVPILSENGSDLLVGQSADPLRYLSDPLSINPSRPSGEVDHSGIQTNEMDVDLNDQLFQNLSPDSNSVPSLNNPLLHDPTLDEFFLAQGMNMQPNDDVFDQFFDDPLNVSGSIFPVSSRNSSQAWRNQSSELL